MSKRGTRCSFGIIRPTRGARLTPMSVVNISADARLHSCQKYLNRFGDSVSHGVRDVAMAKPILQRPPVMAGVGQDVAAGVAQHVRMNREGQAARADALIGRFTAADVKGPSRSVARTKAESGSRRCSSHGALISSPGSGWTEGLPFLSRRTCSEAEPPAPPATVQGRRSPSPSDRAGRRSVSAWRRGGCGGRGRPGRP